MSSNTISLTVSTPIADYSNGYNCIFCGQWLSYGAAGHACRSASGTAAGMPNTTWTMGVAPINRDAEILGELQALRTVIQQLTYEVAALRSDHNERLKAIERKQKIEEFGVEERRTRE